MFFRISEKQSLTVFLGYPTIRTVEGHNAPTEDETMSKVQIKFGKIDRCEPLSIGGTGDMDILARVGGQWVVVGQVEVDAICTYQGCMSSDDRFSVDVFEGYLYADTDATFSVQCFDKGVRVRTAAEARRELKAMIAARITELRQAS
tara:strand:- start:1828 stop:2268 length:441 start_codon:yes stop_codon:yes gene_type:complete